MLDASIISALQEIVGKEHVLTHRVDLVTYSFDATADVPRAIPDVVVTPAYAGDIQRIVNLARSRGIAIYPRGAGTNLSGGTIPLKRGIVLSFQRMNRILEVDAETPRI
jgi:glycolate oxidase